MYKLPILPPFFFLNFPFKLTDALSSFKEENKQTKQKSARCNWISSAFRRRLERRDPVGKKKKTPKTDSVGKCRPPAIIAP